jgi:endonuclease YncB( thermonuclease family)
VIGERVTFTINYKNPNNEYVKEPHMLLVVFFRVFCSFNVLDLSLLTGSPRVASLELSLELSLCLCLLLLSPSFFFFTSMLFATVKMNGEDVAAKVAEAGWAKIREAPSKREADPEHQELIALSRQAQEAKRGIFTEDEKKRKASIRAEPASYDSYALYERCRNQKKPFELLVEHARNGSTLRGVLKPGMESVVMRLAGVQAPAIPYNPETKKEGKPEAFYRESLFFTEQGVLNRDVQLTVTSLDATSNSLVGTISVGGRDLGEELLKAGLARVVDWNAPSAAQLKSYREAETAAQAGRLRMWRDFTPKVVDPSVLTNDEVLGRVREVQNGGNIALTIGQSAVPIVKVMQLSSVNVPRLNPRDGDDEPFAWEAKQFLRKRLIGKKVRAQLDYTRELKARDGKATPTTREFWSIYLDRTNIAIMLVERGLAKVCVCVCMCAEVLFCFVAVFFFYVLRVLLSCSSFTLHSGVWCGAHLCSPWSFFFFCPCVLMFACVLCVCAVVLFCLVWFVLFVCFFVVRSFVIVKASRVHRSTHSWYSLRRSAARTAVVCSAARRRLGYITSTI